MGGPSLEAQQEAFMQAVFESCPAKTTMAGVGGFGLGALFGLFMSSMETQAGNDEFLKMTTKEQFRYTLKDMGRRMYSSARNFGTMGAIFAGTECVIETFRGKHDIYNGVVGGCITGAMLAANGGPQAMAMGCGGFAVFSYAMEKYMHEAELNGTGFFSTPQTRPRQTHDTLFSPFAPPELPAAFK
ncbi:Tim17/Tim22/Tim23/Pmp24 family-domain-containing protein [Cladochytrium replicatum]|nr:Tim17/Tim22/Tim23/Pmp24 family-domain-containing protein [Cladochytrium replicatum]